MIKNWEDIKESSFLQQEGSFTFTVKDVDASQLSQAGEPKHVYTCETEDGATISLQLSLSDKALWKYKQFAHACGLDTSQGQVDFDALPNIIKGRKFIGVVKQSEPQKTITGEISDKRYYNIVEFKRLV